MKERFNKNIGYTENHNYCNGCLFVEKDPDNTGVYFCNLIKNDHFQVSAYGCCEHFKPSVLKNLNTVEDIRKLSEKNT